MENTYLIWVEVTVSGQYFSLDSFRVGLDAPVTEMKFDKRSERQSGAL